MADISIILKIGDWVLIIVMRTDANQESSQAAGANQAPLEVTDADHPWYILSNGQKYHRDDLKKVQAPKKG